MLEITVNEQQTFNIEVLNDKILLNGKAFEWDMSEIRPGTFHILKDHHSYTAEVLKFDMVAKTLQLKINNHIFSIAVADESDLILRQMGVGQVQSSQASPLKAPMPGLVLEVKVEEQQEVKKGETLVILEAMKMENILKAPTDGIVKSVKVKKGERVEKNQVLIVF